MCLHAREWWKGWAGRDGGGFGGRPIRKLGNRVHVSCICQNPPPFSAVGSDDHKVMVVEAANIMNCWSLEGCGGPIKSLSMHRGGGETWLVAAACADGSVYIWHLTLDDSTLNVDPVASVDCLPITKSAPVSTAPRYDAVFRPNDSTGAGATVELAVLVDNDVEVRARVYALLLLPPPHPTPHTHTLLARL